MCGGLSVCLSVCVVRKQIRVVDLKRDKQTLQSENQMLKGQVEEHTEHQMMLQNKMQKILFCM